jgi:hypothetical protein
MVYRTNGRLRIAKKSLQIRAFHFLCTNLEV